MFCNIPKINHLVILTVLVIVLICIYMYQTMNDVKKISLELKKNELDILKINQDINGLTQSISHIHKRLPTQSIQPTQPDVCIKPAIPVTVTTTVCDDDDDDDNDSTNTEDLKKIIDIEDEQDTLDALVEEKKENKEEKDEVIPLEKMGYDQLKDLCKSKGLSIKGKKSELLERLL